MFNERKNKGGKNPQNSRFLPMMNVPLIWRDKENPDEELIYHKQHKTILGDV